MDLLNNKNKDVQLFHYMKQAIEKSNCELEFIYGSNRSYESIDRSDFIRILSVLKQKFGSNSEENTLDISIRSVRCSISGIDDIKKYCKTDSVKDIPNKIFVEKRKYHDPSFPSVKYDPIIDYDYNYRINLKTEKMLEESNPVIQGLLNQWSKELKLFRYKKRFSFITNDNLFRIDLTSIKTNEYDRRARKMTLFKSFIESGILNNKETYELEIEYIGSTPINKEYPIDNFMKKNVSDREGMDKELSKKFNSMKNEWSTKICEGDNEFSEIVSVDIAPYEDDYLLGVKGIDEDNGEFSEVIIYSEGKQMVTPSYSFEDIQYEYWVDSNREWLFEAILTFDKKIHYISHKPNTNGGYDNSPQNTDYIEYSIYPEFTKEEKEEVKEINDQFNHIILIPESQIIKITKFKKELSWGPSKVISNNKIITPSVDGNPNENPNENPEWRPEVFDFSDPPLIQFEDLKEAGEFNDDIEIQGRLFEKRIKKEGSSKINDTTRELIKVFKSNIEEILKLKEDTDIIVKKNIQERVILEYRSLTEQTDSNYIRKKKNELKRLNKDNKDNKEDKDKIYRLEFEIKRLEVSQTKLIGPNPVSMSLENIVHDMKHSIVEGYVVTEKADGIRAQLLIGTDRMGYLITQKLEIIGTDIRFDNCPGNWLFDGEYITQNKKGNPIQLFAIFDIYYSSDGHSIYPDHAYTYPWIGRKKKDICRFSIMNEFKNKVTMNLDNTDMRITYKNYLEGPKKLQQSKKDKTKYSNIGGICKQSKKLWDINTKKEGYEYSVDGLIYMPMYLSVGSMEEGVSKKSFGGEWSINYKWKPPEENTIDFKVRVVKEKTKSGERDKITSSVINDKIIKCKQVHLYVGYDIKKDPEFDYNWKLLTNDTRKPFSEILFNPDKDNKSFYICNIPLKNNKLLCEKDKSEILNNQIIEMRYSPENPEEMRWSPLRLRKDKIKPQFFVTANKIWNTIINPVTTEMITGLEDLHTIKSLLKYKIDKGIADPISYYVDEESEANSDISLRKFHNYIKNNLITAICSIGNSPISVMDTSMGRGGDINKYLHSKNKIKFLLGLDISTDINRAAKRFYLETKRKPKAMFIQYDTSESIRDGFGYKGSDTDIERNKNLIDIIYNKNKKTPKEYNIIHKNYDKIAEKGFNIISSQFTVHYYFKDELTLRGYLQNLRDNCVKGGYFIGTCYDGGRVFELLKDKDKYEMTDEFSNIIFSIRKDYDVESFDYLKNNIKSMFGQEITVEMSSIGQPIKEYLVNFDMFKDMMKVYGFKLVSPELKGIYNGIFNKAEFSTEDGLGNFGQIIDKLPKLAEKDKLLKTVGPFYRANEINMKKNEKLKHLSSLNNWFIFQKS